MSDFWREEGYNTIAEWDALNAKLDKLRAENERLVQRAAHYEANWNNAEHVIGLRDAQIKRLMQLTARMIEHLEHCSDTWTATDPLLADLRTSN